MIRAQPIRPSRGSLWAVLSMLAIVATNSPLMGAASAPEPIEDLEQQLLAQPESSQVAFDLAGVYREEGEIERGVEFFTRFHEAQKPNPMSLAWQGSLKTMMSASGNDLEERLNQLQSGVADMDRAARLFPDNVQVKLVRGITISNFPTFLGMAGRAIRDLNEVLESKDDQVAGAEGAVREALARAYRQAGREEDAVAVLAQPGS